MKIRAAVLKASPAQAPFAESRPLVIEELDLDPPGPEEVLVRIGAAGLCHSDLSVINGNRPRPVPMVLGHEAAGTVVQVGSAIRDLAPGDRVVMTFQPTCGACLPCAEGRPALCIPGAEANGRGVLMSGDMRLHDGGTDVHHHCGVSAYADHAVVSRHSVVRVDAEDIPFAELALFGCAVQTGVGAVLNTCRVQPGQSVAIVGLGGVGLAALLGAVAAGATEIVAVDLSDDKLALAQELGATRIYNAAKDGLSDRIRADTGGGVDHAVELAGAAPAFELAYRITRRGGQTVTAGLPAPTAEFRLPAVNVVADERTVKGSYMGSCVPQRDIPRFIRMYRAGQLPVDRLLTRTLRLDEINEGFDLLDRGEAIRQVVVFD
ncbi:zinc-dependent alcohol dehydrogenase family protein [Paracoccus aerius]|uniref:Zinc-dependent alcohol dehydrogenase family protein n=1 Tax=Paracoccus aerius TaxID=1915382 RepID=A0ABS1S0X8_9RHOB|nr:zinc-dependent alcohol dehydrogenase family protein [Paracoccus aerius]MBL3672346.1 zinc-dependent alcohol dehydrogenase family protein [Paracoccus aerius]GHG10735.1 alcohol dehydrogenase [Paracoccus aerius]